MPYKGERPLLMRKVISLSNEIFNYLRASPFIDVFATARKHGFTVQVVKTYKDPQHYFGLVLVE